MPTADPEKKTDYMSPDIARWWKQMKNPKKNIINYASYYATLAANKKEKLGTDEYIRKKPNIWDNTEQNKNKHNNKSIIQSNHTSKCYS